VFVMVSETACCRSRGSWPMLTARMVYLCRLLPDATSGKATHLTCENRTA
jgi:hypothetical protein